MSNMHNFPRDFRSFQVEMKSGPENQIDPNLSLVVRRYEGCASPGHYNVNNEVFLLAVCGLDF